MLFHNRPVKAAMGSVIANGGVQLSDGKSLVKTKLATLHLGGTNENELAALNKGAYCESESCHSSHNSLFGETVNWFRSAELISGDLAFAEETKVQRRNGDEDFLNVALACKDGNRSWTHKTVLA